MDTTERLKNKFKSWIQRADFVAFREGKNCAKSCAFLEKSCVNKNSITMIQVPIKNENVLQVFNSQRLASVG